MIAFLCEPRHLSHPSLRILQQNCRTCDSEIPISDNFPMNHNKAQSTKNSRTKFFFIFCENWWHSIEKEKRVRLYRLSIEYFDYL